MCASGAFILTVHLTKSCLCSPLPCTCSHSLPAFCSGFARLTRCQCPAVFSAFSDATAQFVSQWVFSIAMCAACTVYIYLPASKLSQSLFFILTQTQPWYSHPFCGNVKTTNSTLTDTCRVYWDQCLLARISCLLEEIHMVSRQMIFLMMTSERNCSVNGVNKGTWQMYSC